MRKILGFLGYFRRFVEDFAKIAKPLYRLLQRNAKLSDRMDRGASVRWNNSREASTENEEKQKGLNIGKRKTCYDRSLTPIILYSITDLSHP